MVQQEYPSYRPQGFHHVNGGYLAGYGVLWTRRHQVGPCALVTAFSRLVASTPRHVLLPLCQPRVWAYFRLLFYSYLGGCLFQQLQRPGYRPVLISSVALRVGSAHGRRMLMHRIHLGDSMEYGAAVVLLTPSGGPCALTECRRCRAGPCAPTVLLSVVRVASLSA